jgi:putative PIN family toxin of toxin-antitoxin system
MNVVLDTNILVSALWSDSGNPAKVARLITDRVFQLYFNTEILTEYHEVLNRPKFGFSALRREKLLATIYKYGTMVFVDKSGIAMTDESDRVFYDVAKTCGAYLVTGNIKHYPAEPFIISPADFLLKFED